MTFIDRSRSIVNAALHMTAWDSVQAIDRLVVAVARTLPCCCKPDHGLACIHEVGLSIRSCSVFRAMAAPVCSGARAGEVLSHNGPIPLHIAC